MVEEEEGGMRCCSAATPNALLSVIKSRSGPAKTDSAEIEQLNCQLSQRPVLSCHRIQ